MTAAARTRRRMRPRLREIRTPLLWIAAARAVVAIVAIPLAPFLYREHYLVLVLMRPTKEVLMFGGFLARRGDANLVEIVIAAVPLVIGGVWLAYALGRLHHEEIRSGRMPGIGARILPPPRVKRFQKVLRRKGTRLVLIGRLAAFPSTVLGAAAGASRMDARTFLPVDAAGGVLSIAEVLTAGYLVGGAFEQRNYWVTGIGIAAFVLFSALLGWYLRRD